MHAIIRRYEATDKMRTTEIVKKAQDSLLPRMSEMPSFSGYYLIEAGNGVFSSVSVFDTEAHAGESTRVASTWVREENLQTALTNPPKITSGKDKPMNRGRRATGARDPSPSPAPVPEIATVTSRQGQAHLAMVRVSPAPPTPAGDRQALLLG